MSKYIAVIPRAAITRAALVEAGGRSMEQVKAACGCQYILNSWFYDTITGRPVGNLKIDGTVKAAAGWNGWGLTWDKGADIRLDILPDNGGASYLSGVELLTPTRGPGKALSYSPEYGGTRGRSAVLLAGARVILYCSGDGTADAKTPEGLRDELVSIGFRYDQAANLRALGLDAGSSSNCDFGDGQRISNGKRVKGYLCIWTTEGGQEPPDKEESMGKYKVTPSIGINIRSGPGTGYGKVGAYPMVYGAGQGRLRVPVHSQFLVLRHDHGPPGGQSQDRRHSQSGRRLERLGADLGQGRRHPPGHLTRQRRGFLPQRRGAADAHQGAG